MPSFTRTATIERSPGQVFAVLDDVNGAPRWMPAIKRIEVLTPDQPVGVGFQWRETRRVLGVIPMTFTIEVVRHEAPKAWGISFTDGKVRTGAAFTLAATGQGTQVTLEERCDDLVGKPKRAERIARMMERSDGDLLERLKRHVESSTPVEAKATKATPSRKAKR